MVINQYFVFIIDGTERPRPRTIQMLFFSPWCRITFLKSVSQNFHLLTLAYLSIYSRLLTLCFTFTFEKWFDRYYIVWYEAVRLPHFHWLKEPEKCALIPLRTGIKDVNEKSCRFPRKVPVLKEVEIGSWSSEQLLSVQRIHWSKL